MGDKPDTYSVQLKGSEMLIKLLFQCCFINPSANSSAVWLPEFKISLSEREKAFLIWINIFIGTVLKLSMKLPNVQKAIPTCICIHISIHTNQIFPHCQLRAGWLSACINTPLMCIFNTCMQKSNLCESRDFIKRKKTPQTTKLFVVNTVTQLS